MNHNQKELLAIAMDLRDRIIKSQDYDPTTETMAKNLAERMLYPIDSRADVTK